MIAVFKGEEYNTIRKVYDSLSTELNSNIF